MSYTERFRTINELSGQFGASVEQPEAESLPVVMRADRSLTVTARSYWQEKTISRHAGDRRGGATMQSPEGEGGRRKGGAVRGVGGGTPKRGGRCGRLPA